MFSDWTDPHDIDHYYGDIGGLMKDIQDSPSSRMYQSMPVQMPSRAATELKPEQPTGVIMNTPPVIKNAFEVEPGSIFMDGHSVGKQPDYNILRSGPPTNPLGQLESFSQFGSRCQIDWVHIIMFIVFVFLIGMLMQARSEVNSANMAMKMLLAMSRQQLHTPNTI
jgi:hypothetical protein